MSGKKGFPPPIRPNGKRNSPLIKMVSLYLTFFSVKVTRLRPWMNEKFSCSFFSARKLSTLTKGIFLQSHADPLFVCKRRRKKNNLS